MQPLVLTLVYGLASATVQGNLRLFPGDGVLVERTLGLDGILGDISLGHLGGLKAEKIATLCELANKAESIAGFVGGFKLEMHLKQKLEVFLHGKCATGTPSPPPPSTITPSTTPPPLSSAPPPESQNPPLSSTLESSFSTETTQPPTPSTGPPTNTGVPPPPCSTEDDGDYTWTKPRQEPSSTVVSPGPHPSCPSGEGTCSESPPNPSVTETPPTSCSAGNDGGGCLEPSGPTNTEAIPPPSTPCTIGNGTGVGCTGQPSPPVVTAAAGRFSFHLAECVLGGAAWLALAL